jgi:uncharacterized membrane protein
METFVTILFYMVIGLLIWLAVLQSKFNTFKEWTERIFKSLPDSEFKHEPKAEIEITSETRQKIEEPVAQKVIEPQKFERETDSPSSDFNFEKFFMENIFNKIGAIALVVGIGIFIKLVSSYFVFTPPMQIATGFLAGLAMVFVSIKFHKDETKNWAEVLMGAGFAVLFIATYCGHSLYHLIPTQLAFIIGFLLILATYFVAQKYNTFSTIAIGLVGGYLNPFLINSGISANSANFLFGYLIFLNLISIVYVQKNRSKVALNFVNLILTTLTVSIISGFSKAPMIVFPIVLWAAYLVNDLLLLKNEEERTPDDMNNALLWVNFGVLIWFANFIFQFEDKMSIGITILLAGGVYAACAWFKKSKDYLYGFLCSVLISTYFLSDGVLRVCLWSAESAIIALAAKRFNLKILENWSLTFISASVISLLFTKNAFWVSNVKSYTPILNMRTLLFVAPALGGFLCSHVLAKQNEKLSQFLKFLYISLIYLFLTVELNLILSKCAASHSSLYITKFIAYSIVGFIYAANMKRLGSAINSGLSELFNFAGYLIYSAALLTLLSCSFSEQLIPIANVRFVAFIIAICTTLFYAKNSTRDFFKYAAIGLGLFALSFEIVALLHKMNIYDSNSFLSIAWLVYSGIIMLTGIFKSIERLKLAGIWITIAAILKLLFFDLSNIDAIYKVLAFLSLGVMLMIVSYFYTKNRKKD